MALSGRAFLALWNDVSRSREPEYDRWHTIEHVPERVAVTGFIGARRYVNRRREHHRYFTLYDVADLATFEHPDYIDVMQNPTPWSSSMRPDFRNFLRAACRVISSRGEGIAAALATLCHEHEAALERPDALETLLAQPGVTACHLGEVTGGSSSLPWTTPPPDAAPTRGFDRVLLIEALDRESAAGALATARCMHRLETLAPDFGCDVYDLAFVFPGHDPRERLQHRRGQWDA